MPKLDGKKRSRSVDIVRSSSSAVDNDENPRKSKQVKATTATSTSSSTQHHTAQLSGATRNMRFMQRGTKTVGTSSSLRHSYPPPTNTSKNTVQQPTNVITEPHQTTKEVENIKQQTSDGNTTTRSVHIDHDPITGNVDGNFLKDSSSTQTKLNNNNDNKNNNTSKMIQWERATPLDMFGPEVCIVLGRRSYNGFNSITASNLYIQQQHLEYEEKLKQRRRSSNTNDAKADQQRYKELSRDIQKEDKKKPSSSLSSKNSSNKKKRDLDEILKSVGA